MSQIWDNKILKQACFHKKAREMILSFPHQVRRAVGQTIFDLQKGVRIGMPLLRPMPGVGAGVVELRLKDSEKIYRIFCLTNHPKAVLVFHAFIKKTQQTPKHAMELGQKRLKELKSEVE